MKFDFRGVVQTTLNLNPDEWAGTQEEVERDLLVCLDIERPGADWDAEDVRGAAEGLVRGRRG